MRPEPSSTGDAGSQLDSELVSVITPSYNTGAFLREAIESVLGQTYRPIEAIVVDDGSTDSTGEVVRSFGDRITGIRQENAGVCQARSRGVAAARGRYLLFLDADDVLSPDMIEWSVKLLREEPDAIAASKWRRLIRRGADWVKVRAEVPLPAADIDPLDAWLHGAWFPPCCLVWRRETFDRIGGWDEELTGSNEDGDLVFRALVNGVRLGITQGGEAFYRSHGQESVSLSSDVVSEHRLRSRMRVLDKLAANLEARGSLARHAEALGFAWQCLALNGFRDHPALARECQRRGESYGGRQPVSRTFPGRLLARLVGLERKEALVEFLARHGIATRERRRFARLRRLQDPETPAASPGGGPPPSL